MQQNSLKDYKSGLVHYTHVNGKFVHNFESDHQIFLLESHKYKEAVVNLRLYGELIHVYDILWTKEYLVENIKRLSINNEISKKLFQTPEKTVFKAVIIKMNSHQYKMLVQGSYEVIWPAEENPKLIDGVLLYSNNIERFFRYSSLILGPGFVNEKGDIVALPQQENLAGSSGWQSIEEMIQVANYCSDWLVLRSAEDLLSDFLETGKDIDILCRNLTDFILAVNGRQKSQSNFTFQVDVLHKLVDIDASYIGDDYYDQTWQRDMLATKSYQGIVPQLNIEHYFYSLLYHARIHKNIVKSTYVPLLRQMAKVIMLNFDEKILFNDKNCAQFLDEYFDLNGYKLTYPQDYACYENINRKVSRHVTHVKAMPFNADFTWRLLKNRVFLRLCTILPRSLKDNLKRVLNR